jgi:hypothetical protein
MAFAFQCAQHMKADKSGTSLSPARASFILNTNHAIRTTARSIQYFCHAAIHLALPATPPLAGSRRGIAHRKYFWTFFHAHAVALA